MSRIAFSSSTGNLNFLSSRFIGGCLCSQTRYAATPLSKRVTARQSTTAVISEPPSLSQRNDGIRINKCFKSFASRRESDHFIASGRVNINGRTAKPGARVFPGDVVEFDGTVVEWERLTVDVATDDFVYVKHWKDVGVICTTDSSIENNIINQVSSRLSAHDRIFPVGRLDETSSGIIILTSDGRLPNAVLGASKNCTKEYIVTPDMYVSDDDIQTLREGVVIKTIAQRDRNVRKPIVKPTLPCDVERREGLQLFIRLKEGRNRQIRKMLGVLGYTTRAIHRITFMGIDLHGLSGPGDVANLKDEEMKLIMAKLER